MRQIYSFIKFYLYIHLILILISLPLNLRGEKKVDTVSSATCPAVKKVLPRGLSIKVDGKVRNRYNLTHKYLSGLSTVRIRTREITPDGNVMGAYIYNGIPVYFLLDGIAPHKDKNDRFDRPLDLIVTFSSASGKSVSFSYGELTMCDDNDPVTLAYHRSQLLPSKDPEKYNKNRYKKPLNNFRLICPGDRYDNRYLDNVVLIRLLLLPTTDNLLPNLSKGKECRSENLFFIRDGKKIECSFDDIPKITIHNWFRIGHGRGIKSENLDSVKGYALRTWINKHYPAAKPGDFFVFIGCDGYRSIFSWSEIFQTENGEKMIIITERNGIREKKGLTLGPLGDFFVDRDIWGLSCVEKVTL